MGISGSVFVKIDVYSDLFLVVYTLRQWYRGQGSKSREEGWEGSYIDRKWESESEE